MSGLGVKDDAGVWGTSYTMWINIDPHLFMFALLPCLLAGDAMSIDTSVAKRVAYQCLYLAGPGVAISAFITALFLKAFLGWTFLLSMVAGSILCATDPVAVVALLKELGASPVLTIQIQGESLLNDGTAIVVYMISYNMLSGQDYDFADIAMFLVKKAMMAWALGLFIGYAFFSWIRAAGDRLNHASSIIQISLTLCCAYWSFIIVEGVLHLSGVLAVVASSLVLAHHMWPHIVAPDSLHHVWHTFESLGNIIVFFLAGALTGDVITKTEFIDFVNLMVIYLFLMVLRGALIFFSVPILRRLGPDEVSLSDVALMTWGGLRGAVGLVLAIQVHNDLAPNPAGVPQISAKDGQRLLFFVSGIAFLTMVINAVSAPLLVSKLGITALPHARQQLLTMFHQQLVNWSEDSSNPPDVTESLKKMLQGAEKEIQLQKVQEGGPSCTRVEGIKINGCDPESTAAFHAALNIRNTEGNQTGPMIDVASTITTRRSWLTPDVEPLFQSNQDLIDEFHKLREEFKSIPAADLRYVLARLPESRDLASEEYTDMVALIRDQWVDVGMAKVVNAALMDLVYANYWKLMEGGDLRPGSKDSDVLLTSIRICTSPYRADLLDFKEVRRQLDEELENASVLKDATVFEDIDSNRALASLTAGIRGYVGRFARSNTFNIGISVAIFLNSIQVAVEEATRNDSNDNSIVWLTLDGVFTCIFVFEFVIKFILQRLQYFSSAWNRFDFFLAALGVFGFVMDMITRASDSSSGKSISGEARIIRVARVLRTLRFLRVFRLFHARLSADKYISVELANHMIKIQTWTCFAQAHLRGQEDMIKYFGGNGILDTTDEAELARCILQSQVGVYRALSEVVSTQRCLQKPLLDELYIVTERKIITEGLEKFVLDAHHHGALSNREAHTILHHLHHQINACLALISERSEGFIDSNMSRKMEEAKARDPPRSPTSQSAHSSAPRCRTEMAFGHTQLLATLDPLLEAAKKFKHVHTGNGTPVSSSNNNDFREIDSDAQTKSEMGVSAKSEEDEEVHHISPRSMPMPPSMVLEETDCEVGNANCLPEEASFFEVLPSNGNK
jgi:NhaP-type Na+/H+ or K+/H+ antiporter